MTRALRSASVSLFWFLLATVSPGLALAQGTHRPFTLSRMGILYAGGREVSSSGQRGGAQTQWAEQALVHYMLPEKVTYPYPVVMIPGFGLTSYLYLGTPDQRPGWAQIFASEGFGVFVFDEPNNAISGFNVNPFNTVRSGETDPGQSPQFTLWSNESVWRNWGIGPQANVFFEDSKYPKDIVQLQRSMTPVFSDGAGGRFGFLTKSAALLDLLQMTGPAVLIVHSAAGMTGFEAARQRPDLVKGIVVVEPVGCPEEAADVQAMLGGGKFFFGVFGDHFEVRGMQGRLDACEATARLAKEAGARSEVLWLPREGIHGNTHLLMQDTNNDEIARRIVDFMRR